MPETLVYRNPVAVHDRPGQADNSLSPLEQLSTATKTPDTDSKLSALETWTARIPVPVLIGGGLLVATLPPTLLGSIAIAPHLVAALSSGLLVVLTLAATLAVRAARVRAAATEAVMTNHTKKIADFNRALREEITVRMFMERKLEERNESLRLINLLGQSANTATCLEDVLEEYLREVCAHTNWPVGHAFIPDPENSECFVSSGIWHIGMIHGLDSFVATTEKFKALSGEGLIGGVISTGQPQWVNNLADDPHYLRRNTADDLPIQAGFAFPVLAGHKVVAVLEFYATISTEPDQNILEFVAHTSTQLGRTAERVAAERELRSNEQLMRLVTNSLTAAVTYSDEKMRLRFINSTGAEWLAMPSEALIGEWMDDKIKALNFDEMQGHVDEVLSGAPSTFDTKVVFPDGEKRDIIISYIPHFDERQHVIGYFSIYRDVTHRREMEQQLNQSQKMEAIGHLTGGIAHDFNNLLMVIGGYNQRALDNIDEPQTVRPALEEVASSAERAGELTKQLLAFSRRQVMEKRIFRVGKAVDAIKDLLERSAGERYTISIDDQSGNACIQTDGGDFSQAIVNLVINARDAMPGGGRISIALKTVDLNENFTAIRPNMAPGAYAAISVEDHGKGIDDETLNHIFEPFFTTKDQGKGTGLGLSMVYGLLHQSAGSVEVETAVDEGTSICMYFPLAEGDPEELVADIESDHRGNGETVLLVEDDAALLELVRSMLDALGYNVLAASDGTEALEIDAEYEANIDLILSDVVMPILGGFEMVEMIRESRPGIKAVFMSGYTNRASATDTELPENTEFLQKPVNPRRLAQVVHQQIHTEAAQPAPV